MCHIEPEFEFSKKCLSQAKCFILLTCFIFERNGLVFSKITSTVTVWSVMFEPKFGWDLVNIFFNNFEDFTVHNLHPSLVIIILRKFSDWWKFRPMISCNSENYFTSGVRVDRPSNPDKNSPRHCAFHNHDNIGKRDTVSKKISSFFGILFIWSKKLVQTILKFFFLLVFDIFNFSKNFFTRLILGWY